MVFKEAIEYLATAQWKHVAAAVKNVLQILGAQSACSKLFLVNSREPYIRIYVDVSAVVRFKVKATTTCEMLNRKDAALKYNRPTSTAQSGMN